jgi:hypothetical protein
MSQSYIHNRVTLPQSEAVHRSAPEQSPSHETIGAIYMATQDDELDQPLLSLSAAPTQARTLYGGIVLVGSPGSGKSSTAGKQIAAAFLRASGMSGLTLASKSEDIENWIAYAEATGREQDLIVFRPKSGEAGIQGEEDGSTDR